LYYLLRLILDDYKADARLKSFSALSLRMLLTRRRDSNQNQVLDIVFFVAVAVLFTLLCTVAILHCLLRRQRRQNIQHDPHPIVMLYISPSEPYAHWQEKINHDNAVALISKYKYLPNKSGCPFRFSRLSPSSLEKASGSDISNRLTIDRPIPIYIPPRQSILRPT